VTVEPSSCEGAGSPGEASERFDPPGVGVDVELQVVGQHSSGLEEALREVRRYGLGSLNLLPRRERLSLT